MKQHTEIPYWISIAHLPKWRTERINKLIIKIVHDNKMTMEEFFNLSENDWKTIFELSESEVLTLLQAKKELPNTSFLTEDLLSQGFEVIPINSPEYSKTLKKNLKVSYSPPVLYVKGNNQIMQKNSIAIVGSRKANDVSLAFTDNVAKLTSEQYKVVVSGFAKGVDKQALESALIYKSQSIIVLPQGVLTFKSGIKKYYKKIIEGDVLVVSTFHPKAPWSVGLAMARNPVIYGFAKEIFVAQSDSKGGTYSGVIDGLKKGRKIFVRYPDENEKNANLELISKGGIPVDLTGKIIQEEAEKVAEKQKEEIRLAEKTEEKILSVLSDRAFTSKQIVEKTNIEWPSRRVTDFLKTHKDIETIHKKPLRFKKIYENCSQKSLFSDNKAKKQVT